MVVRAQSQRCLELPRGTEPPYVGHGRASPLRRHLWQGSVSVSVYRQTLRCIRGGRALRSDGGCDTDQVVLVRLRPLKAIATTPSRDIIGISP